MNKKQNLEKLLHVQYVIRILNQMMSRVATTVSLLVCIEVVLTKNEIWIIHLKISRYQYFFVIKKTMTLT